MASRSHSPPGGLDRGRGSCSPRPRLCFELDMAEPVSGWSRKLSNLTYRLDGSDGPHVVERHDTVKLEIYRDASS